LQKKRLKDVTLYCDGSSLGNPGAGGWGVILDYRDRQESFSGGERDVTNNRMELRAVIEGLKHLKEPCRVQVVTDSTYVANGINLWLKGWVEKSFKGVKNVDLWKEYLRVSRKHIISAKWIRGHSGHRENELCDRMAKREASNIK
jgi:ribonuclease HI